MHHTHVCTLNLGTMAPGPSKAPDITLPLPLALELIVDGNDFPGNTHSKTLANE